MLVPGASGFASALVEGWRGSLSMMSLAPSECCRAASTSESGESRSDAPASGLEKSKSPIALATTRARFATYCGTEHAVRMAATRPAQASASDEREGSRHAPLAGSSPSPQFPPSRAPRRSPPHAPPPRLRRHPRSASVSYPLCSRLCPPSPTRARSLHVPVDPSVLARRKTRHRK